jgi:sulfur transfer protein SufE
MGKPEKELTVMERKYPSILMAVVKHLKKNAVLKHILKQIIDWGPNAPVFKSSRRRKMNIPVNLDFYKPKPNN